MHRPLVLIVWSHMVARWLRTWSWRICTSAQSWGSGIPTATWEYERSVVREHSSLSATSQESANHELPVWFSASEALRDHPPRNSKGVGAISPIPPPTHPHFHHLLGQSPKLYHNIWKLNTIQYAIYNNIYIYLYLCSISCYRLCYILYSLLY